MYDTVVVGGGLSGLVAARRLADAGLTVAIVDRGLHPNDPLGGFTSFSGAKFSLPPAGLGLLAVTKTIGRLNESIDQVLRLLGLRGRLSDNWNDPSAIQDRALSHDLSLRQYSSIVLSPAKIHSLLHKLAEGLSQDVAIHRATCIKVKQSETGWHADIVSSSHESLVSRAVFFAGGRTSPREILPSALASRAAKGLDVGVRFEFPTKTDVRGLRALGPDAKILWKDCRTFCLNYPGRVYRYPFDSFTIPGGVVADSTHSAANFGILHRYHDRHDALSKLRRRLRQIPSSALEVSPAVSGDIFGDAAQLVSDVLGHECTQRLLEFSGRLGEAGLVDWSKKHLIHLPLLDWHWPCFARVDSFATNLDGLFVIGDSSGHARGLLQAALSGWLAVGEYLGCH